MKLKGYEIEFGEQPLLGNSFRFLQESLIENIRLGRDRDVVRGVGFTCTYEPANYWVDVMTGIGGTHYSSTILFNDGSFLYGPDCAEFNVFSKVDESLN